MTRKSQPSGFTGLAPGDQDADARARHADHHRDDPVAELAGQQRQREHGHQGQHGQAAEHSYPDGRLADSGPLDIHEGYATPGPFRERYRRPAGAIGPVRSWWARPFRKLTAERTVVSRPEEGEAAAYG